jgi:catabolite regulation protein CreA
VEVNTNASEMKEDNSITCADEGRIELHDKEKNIVPETLSLKKCHDG